MNIFYLDKCPHKSATYFYDRHKVKMILECAQMLCTAHHVLGNGDNVPYKKAFENHPCTKWVRENKLHYYWLYKHFMAISNEYEKRYGKMHSTWTKCAWPLFFAPKDMPTKDFVDPPQCMPDKYKVDGDCVKAYWNFYIGEKWKVAHKNEKILEYPN